MIREAQGDAIDAGAFWRALGARPMGAVVATAEHDGARHGFLALSFAHVSASPPTVLVSASRTASALPAMLGSGHFAANLLPAGAEALARAFGGAAAGAARFEGEDWAPFITGAPVLARAAAVFDCRLEQAVELDAATVLIGRVIGLRDCSGAGATLAFGGGYRDLT